jgi:hypothetical protein
MTRIVSPKNSAMCAVKDGSAEKKGGVPKTSRQLAQEALLQGQQQASQAAMEARRQEEREQARQRRQKILRKLRERGREVAHLMKLLPGQIDNLLQRTAGEGNDILHWFLRILVGADILGIVVGFLTYVVVSLVALL